MSDMKPCPFCGDTPELSTVGSCIDIDCCVSMSLQKCDELSMEERQTYNPQTVRYSDEAEQKALDMITERWNTRV